MQQRPHRTAVAKIDDKLFDVGLGATLLGWSLHDAVAGRGASLVGATILGLNALVGVLFLARRAPTRRAVWWESALCLVSVPMSLLALALAPPLSTWPHWAELAFVLAALGAGASLLSMGSAFGVLPAFRGLVQRGPFSVLRHPVYACELSMVLVCTLVSRGTLRWLSLLLAVGLVAARIHLEESLLRREAAYRRYAAQVRWRLFPGLW